jgi:N-acetyl sugar amidotransferase
MQYCTNCCMPNTKPGVFFDERGWCNSCRTVEYKKTINWDDRWKQLVSLADDIKSKNTSQYDCVVPVSGGKDSWYQAYIISEVLGLKTLCVSMAPHLPTTEGISNMNGMIKDLNVDHLKITLKNSVIKKLRKRSFERQGEPNWAEHCCIFSGVVSASLIYDIPLIVWGEDIAFEFGGQATDGKPNALNINKNDLIKDKTVFDFLGDDISPRDVFFYKYPDYKRLEDANIKSIYLGYYIWWDGRKHYNFVKERGFKGREAGPLSGNYINYDNIDEKLCEINIWLKYIKFGFWRATDQTCYDIWNFRLTRNEAVDIVNKLQTEFPKEALPDFLRFHEITEEYFWEVIEKFRNHAVWEKIDGEWYLRNPLTKLAPKTETTKLPNA